MGDQDQKRRSAVEPLMMLGGRSADDGTRVAAQLTKRFSVWDDLQGSTAKTVIVRPALADRGIVWKLKAGSLRQGDGSAGPDVIEADVLRGPPARKASLCVDSSPIGSDRPRSYGSCRDRVPYIEPGRGAQDRVSFAAEVVRLVLALVGPRCDPVGPWLPPAALLFL